MKVHVFRTQMAMAGRFCSYDVEVPIEELTEERRRSTTYQIDHDGRRYATFADATRPDSLDKMPRGWARWEAYTLHQAFSNQIAADIARQAFPEVPITERLSCWYEVGQLGHAVREVEI